MEENINKLTIVGFLTLLKKKVTYYYSSARNTYHDIVYWDDIVELANQYGIEVEQLWTI